MYLQHKSQKIMSSQSVRRQNYRVNQIRRMCDCWTKSVLLCCAEEKHWQQFPWDDPLTCDCSLSRYHRCSSLSSESVARCLPAAGDRVGRSRPSLPGRRGVRPPRLHMCGLGDLSLRLRQESDVVLWAVSCSRRPAAPGLGPAAG